MEPRVAVYTSFTFTYLSRARVLVRTLKLAHPDWTFWALLVDRPPPGVDLSTALADFDHHMMSDRLDIARHGSWLFKHDLVEACTAVKAQMLVELLARGYAKVIYLDPDIAVFHPLDTILERLETSAIVLTPHQLAPNELAGHCADNELTSMRYGIYNLGFIAVRNGEIGRSFARWWAAQLHRACYDEPETGIFTDQKYCDLVPGLFDGVHIERDPGCNVASWNLSRRRLAFDGDGRLLVDGSPLKFYHFTKINGEGEVMTERYAGENTEVIEVWNWYRRAIAAATPDGIPGGYWHYGRFSNGVAIPTAARRFYRAREDLMQHFDDPFAAEGDASFFAWLQRERPDLLDHAEPRAINRAAE